MIIEGLRKAYYFLLDILQTLLLAAAFFLVIYVFLFRPYEVKGDSMFPNFQNNEFVLTNIISLRFHKPVLGDVVVFKAPPDPEKDFIKRVIGVAGDKIYLNNGYVYLNGERLDESRYLKNDVKSFPGSFLRENEEITVPQGEFFVMGDNRPYSSDSREWGFVPEGNIIGTSFIIYWPTNRFEIVKNPYTL